MTITNSGMGGGQRYSYALWLMPNVVDETQLPIDITAIAQGWKRTIRLQGGFWTGSFTIPVSYQAYDSFNTWMGMHIQERSGGMVTWAGIIYEMELSDQGLVRRRSFDDMINHVDAKYTNMLGDEQTTSAAEDTTSIDRHGEKQETLQLGTQLPTVAEALRDKYLYEHASPYPRAVAVSPPGEFQLTVNVRGYAFTMNWLYATVAEYETYEPDPIVDVGTYKMCTSEGTCTCGVDRKALELTGTNLAAWSPYATAPPGTALFSFWSTQDSGPSACWWYIGDVDNNAGDTIVYLHCYQDQGLTVNDVNGTWVGSAEGCSTYRLRGTASAWVEALVALSPFITAGYIEQNVLQVKRDVDDKRCWEALQEAVLGDENGNPWRLYVGPSLKLNYSAVSSTPGLLYRDGEFLTMEGSPTNPWALKPGVVRFPDLVVTVPTPDTWLSDPHDFVVDEFEVDWQGNVTPRLSEIDPTEFLIYYLKEKWEDMGGKPKEAKEGGDNPSWGYWYFNPYTGEFKWTDVPYMTPSAPWQFLWEGVQPG